jgi:hypothetical protein
MSNGKCVFTGGNSASGGALMGASRLQCTVRKRVGGGGYVIVSVNRARGSRDLAQPVRAFIGGWGTRLRRHLDSRLVEA